MKKILAGVIIAGGISPVLGQTKLDVVVRPRFEYRDGFSSPSIDGNVGATFVQQRSRISLTSKVKGVELKLVPQDVRVWGQVPTLNANDGLNSLHEGWMKFNLDTTGKWSAKIGRQELVYDDSRILGNVDWAQQGRSHDAALISYRDNGFKLDGIIAYNQNGVSSVGNIYTLVNQTKGLQALHLNTKIKDFSVSVLALNNLFQDANQTQRLYRMTTVGTFVKFVKISSKFSIKGLLSLIFVDLLLSKNIPTAMTVVPKEMAKRILSCFN